MLLEWTVCVIEKLKMFFDKEDESDAYQTGISTEDAIVLSNRCIEEYGVEIPIDYVTFLKKMNGFWYDGKSMFNFSTDEIKNTKKYKFSLRLYDFFKENNHCRDYVGSKEGTGEDYLFLGKSDISYIAADVRTGKIVLLDEVIGFVREYANFEEMLDGFFLGAYEER